MESLNERGETTHAHTFRVLLFFFKTENVCFHDKDVYCVHGLVYTNSFSTTKHGEA